MIAGVNRETGIPIADFLGLRAADEHPEGAWVGEMSATPDTLNLLGVVHGGATATLIDWAAGWGALHLTGCAGSTTDMFVRYVAAAREGSTLYATATVDRVGAKTMALTVRVADDTGRVVAIGNLGYTIAYRTP
jgi:acyl-CoA thioesterase